MTGEWLTPIPDEPASGKLDTSVPHIARVYDYLLGGKNNFAVDREAAEEFAKAMPSIVTTIRVGRPVLGRAVRFLVRECGIRQFLDIGAGLPTAENIHEVAQRTAPECRVVYVDNDPMVLAHARALLTSTPEGRASYIDADLRNTDKILAEAAQTLDLAAPVAVMLSGVLHCIPDGDGPYGIVTQLMGAVPSGSYLLVAHPASDVDMGAVAATAQISSKLAEPVTFRTRDEIADFFDGLEILEPGLVQPQEWRPEPGSPPVGPLSVWCAVARKP
jgi:O-methyltransferase involved in polyketide biosynthesis